MPDFERRRLRVYIAGPITIGDTWENITNGIRWGRKMLADGLAPYVPHLDAYMTLGDTDVSWNAYLEWDLEWVACSEAVFRLPGASKGADLECEHASALGIPIFLGGVISRYDGDDIGYKLLLSWAKEQELTGVRR